MSGFDDSVVGEPKRMAAVTPQGAPVQQPIAGVMLRALQTHEDGRGSLCELYSDAWRFDDLPMVHAYLVTVRPGQAKGWAMHEVQTDRYAFVSGAVKLVLFDAREGSVSKGCINEWVFSECNRSLVSVPPGVWHVVQNVGTTEGVLFNFPSHGYNYAQPDKLLLPLNHPMIPYRFGPGVG